MINYLLLVLLMCTPIYGSENMENTPQFLYKILSIENWQQSKRLPTLELGPDDQAFVHLATEDQLERILEKYWKNEKTFVILKIDTKKLKGKLVYEANPGGANRYYHLYDGAIPLESVVESMAINREDFKQILSIVETGDPILRQQAHALTPQEILTPKIQSLISKMVNTMRAEPAVGLAAPQIGVPLQIVVIEDKAEYHSHFTPEQLMERGRRPVPLHILINPRLTIDESEEKAEFLEGCLSVPQLVGIVPRAKKVKVEYLNEKAQPTIVKAQGWFARILQHEIDHLNGVLYLDRVQTRTLISEDNYPLWRTKPVKEIQAAFK